MPVTSRLEIPARTGFLPIAITFAEHAALSFGFCRESAGALALATEEVVAALCALELPDLELKLDVRDGVYYTELTISMPYMELALGKINVTAAIEGEEDLDHLGWMLASRMVDGFTIDHQGKRMTRFRLRKHRQFPHFEGEASMPTPGAMMVDVRPGSGQDLILFAQRVLQSGKPLLNRWLMDPPARLTGLVESGEYEVLLGYSDRGDPVAGIILDRTRPNLALVDGPHLIDQPDSAIHRLFHAALERLARTSLLGVVGETLAKVPEDEMEFLGGREFHLEDGSTLKTRAYYRGLREDHGGMVWATPWLEEFLRDEFRRLCLPRDLQHWQPMAEQETPSVISCTFRRHRSECRLRPVLAGHDISANLASHLRLARDEGYKNVTFELDLGQPFHLAFSDALQKLGFEPGVLVPGAGKGDILALGVQP